MLKLIIIQLLLLILIGCEDLSSESEITETKHNDNNGSFTNAEVIHIGDTISVDLPSTEDEDYYKFDLLEDAMLNFECIAFPLPAESNSYVLDLYCSLFDSDGNELFYSFNKEKFTFNFNLKAGSYYLRIKSRHTFAVTAEPGALVLNLETVDLFENNDSTHLAKQILLDTTYKAKIQPHTDNDYYSFHVKEKSLKTIHFSSISGDLEFYAYLTDYEGNYIKEFLPSDSMAYTQVFDSGSYLLKVHDRFYNNSSVTPYKFSVSSYKKDPYELNNSIETATPLDLASSIQGNIYPDGDRDFFSFSILTQGAVTFSVASIPEELSVIKFDIFRSDSSKAGTYSMIEYSDLWETTINLEAGSYFLCLYDGALMSKPVEDLYTLTILQ